MPAQQVLLAPRRPPQDPLTSGDLCRDMYPGVSDQIDDLSALRLVPVPDVGPPFDGELATCATAGIMAGHSWAREIGTVDGPADSMTGTAGMRRSESPGEWPQQFARLLAEALAGARPVRQILPWTSDRARGHLHRLMPLFGGGQRPRVMRVIATRPTREVIEMTVILKLGARTRALAIRLEHMAPGRHLSRHAEHDANGAQPSSPYPAPLRWVCTDIEAA
jgi:hypothetical protein